MIIWYTHAHWEANMTTGYRDIWTKPSPHSTYPLPMSWHVDCGASSGMTTSATRVYGFPPIKHCSSPGGHNLVCNDKTYVFLSFKVITEYLMIIFQMPIEHSAVSWLQDIRTCHGLLHDHSFISRHCIMPSHLLHDHSFISCHGMMHCPLLHEHYFISCRGMILSLLLHEHTFISCHDMKSSLLLHEHSFISSYDTMSSLLLHDNSFIEPIMAWCLVHFYMNTLSRPIMAWHDA